MQAFLYVDLIVAAAYQKALPERVQRQFPAAAVLDIDATSGELVLHYALRLLRESEQMVVYIHVPMPEAGIDALMPLLEELFREQPDRLILLGGDHPRLLRMLQARPRLLFKQVKEEVALEEISKFLGGVRL